MVGKLLSVSFRCLAKSGSSDSPRLKRTKRCKSKHCQLCNSQNLFWRAALYKCSQQSFWAIPVEALFSTVLRLNGSIDQTDAWAVLSALQKILVMGILPSSSSGNTEQIVVPHGSHKPVPSLQVQEGPKCWKSKTFGQELGAGQASTSY